MCSTTQNREFTQLRATAAPHRTKWSVVHSSIDVLCSMHGIKFKPTTGTNHAASRGMHDQRTAWVLICFGNLITNHFIQIARRQFSDTQLLHLYLRKNKKIKWKKCIISLLRIESRLAVSFPFSGFDSIAVGCRLIDAHIMCDLSTTVFFLLSVFRRRTLNVCNKLKYIQLTNCFNGVVERCKQDHIGPRLDRYQSFSHKLPAINFFLLLFCAILVCARACARKLESTVLNNLFGVVRVVQINNGFLFLCLHIHVNFSTKQQALDPFRYGFIA